MPGLNHEPSYRGSILSSQRLLSHRSWTPGLLYLAPVDSPQKIVHLASAKCHHPSTVCGQTTRPRSSRLAYSESPRPSFRSVVSNEPLQPRKTKRSPANGSRPSPSCPSNARPGMPRLMSVRPVASQIRTLLATGITRARPPARAAVPPGSRRCPRGPVLRCPARVGAAGGLTAAPLLRPSSSRSLQHGGTGETGWLRRTAATRRRPGRRPASRLLQCVDQVPSTLPACRPSLARGISIAEMRRGCSDHSPPQ